MLNFDKVFIYTDSHHDKLDKERDDILRSVIFSYVKKNYIIISLGDNGKYPFFNDISLKGNHDRIGLKSLIFKCNDKYFYLSHGDEFEKRHFFNKITDIILPGRPHEAKSLSKEAFNNVVEWHKQTQSYVICGHYHYNYESLAGFKFLSQFSNNNDYYSYITIDKNGVSLIRNYF